MRIIGAVSTKGARKSWILRPERGGVLELQRGVPRLNDLGLARGKGGQSAVPFPAINHLLETIKTSTSKDVIRETCL